MKEVIKRYIGAFLTILLIAAFILKVVDIHRDGTSVRDGDYYLELRAEPNVMWDVTWAAEQEHSRLHFWARNNEENQVFSIKNEGDGKCYILYGNKGLCVGVADDGLHVELQTFEGKESQYWYFERINQYFIVKNSDSGLYVRAIKWGDEEFDSMVLAEYEGDEQMFQYVLTKMN